MLSAYVEANPRHVISRKRQLTNATRAHYAEQIARASLLKRQYLKLCLYIELRLANHPGENLYLTLERG